MTEIQLTSFRMMLSMAEAETLTPFELQQVVTRTEIVLDHLIAERNRLREALSALTAATRKEATYDDVLHRRLWLYIEREEKVLQDGVDA